MSSSFSPAQRGGPAVAVHEWLDGNQSDVQERGELYGVFLDPQATQIGRHTPAVVPNFVSFSPK